MLMDHSNCRGSFLLTVIRTLRRNVFVIVIPWLMCKHRRVSSTARRSILRPGMLYYRRFQNVSEEIRIKGVCIMRKVVAGLFMTLDGVVESPGTWQEHFDEDMGG